MSLIDILPKEVIEVLTETDKGKKPLSSIVQNSNKEVDKWIEKAPIGSGEEQSDSSKENEEEVDNMEEVATKLGKYLIDLLTTSMAKKKPNDLSSLIKK